MRKAYVIADNMISSLGVNSAEHVEKLRNGKSGITRCTNSDIFPSSFQASIVDWAKIERWSQDIGISLNYTRFRTASYPFNK